MNKHCVHELPMGYREVLSIDLQKDTKQALLVNGLAIAIAAVMLVPGFLLAPTFKIGGNLPTLAAFLVCAVVYMVLHELVHGACMKLFGAKRVRFGFTGLYAFADSEEYFKKGAYIVVALAPLVVLGAVLLALNIAAGAQYFWFVYLLQLINVSGAAGDLYVSFRFLRMPKDILVRDTGVSMTVFASN